MKRLYDTPQKISNRYDYIANSSAVNMQCAAEIFVSQYNFCGYLAVYSDLFQLQVRV